MTVQDLIKLESHEVRNSNDLMAFYLEAFEKQFGGKPNCAGCTFKNDWNKLKNAVQITAPKTTIMSNKTFELSRRESNKIFTYLEDKRPIRTYGYKMTEDFAVKYLTTGTKEQLEERKKAFNTLPESLREVEDPKTIEVDGQNISLKDATGKQMNAYAEENDIDFGDATRVDDKRAVIEKAL